MRRGVCLVVVALLVGSALWAHGQEEGPNADLLKKLGSQFVLTKTTADKSDIVTAGSVLALKKDGLLMYAVASPMPPMNTYRNGRVTQGLSGFGRDLGITLRGHGEAAAGSSGKRKFVSGEKFWIIGYSVQSDGVLLELYSDPCEDVRYYGHLKIQFPKGTVPPPDEVMNTIAEVITVQPNDNANAGQNAPPPSSQAPPGQPQALAPLAPPPPPADAPPPPPKTISIGQTKDEVVAIFGQPQKVVKLATKEVLYYPDMKVTFVKGKVTDVQ